MNTAAPARHDLQAHVGIVCAMGMEAAYFTDRMSGVIKVNGNGFIARAGGIAGKRVVVIESGIGRTAARRGVEALLAGHAPRWILSAGFAGGLSPTIKLGEILLAKEVAAIDGTRRAIAHLPPNAEQLKCPARLHLGTLLTVDEIIEDPGQKRSLGENFGALAVDMETSAVADVCQGANVPFLSIRVVSDDVDKQLPPEVGHLLMQTTRLGKLGAFTGAILRRPSSFKDFVKLKADAFLAGNCLGDFVAGLIPSLA